jgi:TonB family protein
VGLHVLVGYFLLTGLIRTVLPSEAPRSIATVQIEHPPRIVPSLPPTAVDLTRHRPPIEDLPIPPLAFVTEALPRVTDPEEVRSSVGVPGEPGVAADIQILGKHQLPATEDYYPPQRRRDGIEGASYVRVCVDAQGARAGDAALERSSGDAQLDGAALNVARHGRYARSVQSGHGVPNCYHFRIVFRIK